jgi:hypothetical protein
MRSALCWLRDLNPAQPDWLEIPVDPTRAAALIATALVSLLFCLGLGWGPTEFTLHPERLALLGLAAAGLIWPAVILQLVRRRHREIATRQSSNGG